MLRAAEHAIALRPELSGDAEFLFLIYAGTREEELASVPWSGEQKEAFLRMQFEAQRKWYVENYPGAVFQVIVADGADAGRLYIYHVEGEIRIMDIALLPEFRNHGIGTALLLEILEEGRRRKSAVTVHVETFNPALRLYERLGFRKARDKGVYWLMEWRVE